MGIDVVTLTLAKGYTDEKIRDAAFGDVSLDTSLTKKGQAADAKAVGDAIADKVDKSEIATEEDVMDMLSELGAVAPVTMADGSIITSPTGEIYTL